MPLLLLVLVAGGAWLLRENGILLGRDTDGPLEGGFPHAAGTYEPGQISHLVSFVEGDGHRVESARPGRVSPGLEVMGPVSYERERTSQLLDTVDRWPPPDTRPFRDVRVKGPTSIGFGARATRPGFYYLVGMRYRSRKGLRRFDETEDAGLCFHVAPPGSKHRCPDPMRIERFEGLAEIGGPSDYGAGRFSEQDEEVFFLMRRGGTVELTITISNLSDDDREVPRLELGVGGDPTYRDPVDPMPSDPPTPFTIPAGGSREVEVRARVTECDRYDEAQSTTFESIEAGDDDVELSVPVSVGGPCR